MAQFWPFETGGTYLNNDFEQGDAWHVRDVFGSRKYARLAAVKSTHDPDILFHHDPNITPPQP